MAEPTVLRSSVPFEPKEVRTTAAARIPALDGLRGIAILQVLLWHGLFDNHATSSPEPGFWSLLHLTWSGVDLFFVLSGFLIGGILLDAKESPRYFATFYLRRAYRILPVYSVAVGIYALRYLPVESLHRWAGATSIPLGAYFSFMQNFWMAAKGTWGTVGLAATWSLAIEEQFYLVAPLLVRRFSRAKLVYVLSAFALLAPMLRAGLLLGFHLNCLTAYVLMPCRADALCLGMLSAILVRDARVWGFLRRNRLILYWVTLGTLAGVLGLGYQGYTFCDRAMAVVGYSLLAFFYSCCLFIALAKTPVAQRLLCDKRLIRLGGISYCVYLVHLPLIEGCRYLLEMWLLRLGVDSPQSHRISVLPGAILGITLALVIAELSWWLLEQPMIRRGHAHQY